MAGCATGRALQSSQPLQHDSVRIEVVERVVEVVDTAYVEIPEVTARVVARDSSLLENQFARSRAEVLESGELLHSLETKPQRIFQPIASQHTICDSILFRGQVIRQLVEVERELTKWQRWRLDAFWVMSTFVAAIILAILYRR